MGFRAGRVLLLVGQGYSFEDVSWGMLFGLGRVWGRIGPRGGVEGAGVCVVIVIL